MSLKRPRSLSPHVYSKRQSLSSPPKTPQTPNYPAIPFDSPNNPFGQKRSLNLTLPRTTPFAKHIALRFQLIRDGLGGKKNGVYRIVQVPLNYSFRHLHSLLLFLFGGHPVSPALYPSKRRSTRRITTKGKTVNREVEGHIFEVQKDVTMYNEAYKPGQIRTAKTRVKLSSVRDPYRYRGDDDFAGYGFGGGVQFNEPPLEEDQDWRWEVEEDFMVSHAWPDGGDLERGIVYHHDSHTQVHITVNTSTLPTRKGVGNKPFVFRARGVVDLWSSEDEREEDRPEVVLTPDSWNTHSAFNNFLKLSSARERAKREEDNLDDISIYPAMSDIDDMSSDPTTPGFDSSRSDSAFSLSLSSSPLSTPITPFPKHPVHALRVEHAHRQMVRLTKKGLAGLDSESDDDEKEVDQLADSDGKQDQVDESEEQEEELNWDPFGDEAELC